eukprot:COSAG02_NODE_36400_length_455_cov_0.584270_1_plen_60_part_01
MPTASTHALDTNLPRTGRHQPQPPPNPSHHDLTLSRALTHHRHEIDPPLTAQAVLYIPYM